jgi:tRNA-modifying protein YgfZ
MAWGALQASGPDARAWLNGIVTCDVERVVADRGEWGLLLNKRGKIVCDITLIPRSEGLCLGTSHDPQRLFEILDGYLVMEDVNLELAQGLAWFTLHGQGAFELARSVAEPGDAAAQLVFSDEEAAVLVVPAVRAAACRQIMEGERGAQVFDDDAWASYRVEHGIPSFGTDFGPEDNPHEASLDRRTVSWTKGCYLGQEVVCMQDMRGKVKRRLVRLKAERPVSLSAGAPVLDEHGNEVGRVTTVRPWVVAGSSLKGEQGVALARLKTPHYEPGSEVLLDGVTATVLALSPAREADG